MKTVDIHGRPYVEVKERVMHFHDKYPDGKIETEIFNLEMERVIMRATVTPDSKHPERFFTGTAYEVKGEGNINKTSYIENCETSAVGRALGFLGIGIDGAIASAEEMAIQLDPIDMEQLGKIKDFIDGFKKFDEPAFLKFLGAESVETIPSNKFNAAVMALEKKKKKEGV